MPPIRQLEELLKVSGSELFTGMPHWCAQCVLGKQEPDPQNLSEEWLRLLEKRLDKFLHSPCPELLHWVDALKQLRQCLKEYLQARENWLLQEHIIKTYEESYFRLCREQEAESEV